MISYSKKLEKLTGVKTFDQMVKMNLWEVLRVPNVGYTTIRKGFLELLKKKLGKKWTEILWQAMLEEVMEEKSDKNMFK